MPFYFNFLFHYPALLLCLILAFNLLRTELPPLYRLLTVLEMFYGAVLWHARQCALLSLALRNWSFTFLTSQYLLTLAYQISLCLIKGHKEKN